MRLLRNCIFITLLGGCGGETVMLQKKATRMGTLNQIAPLGSFRALMSTVLVPKCVECHNPGKSDGGIRYDTYEQVMLSTTVVAGASSSSKMCLALTSGDIKMFTNQVTTEDTKAICDWIDKGALND